MSGSSQWVNLIPNGASGSPPARSGRAASYDTTNSVLIVFGGCGGYCAPALNDVWVLSHANGQGGTPSWKQLSAISGTMGRANVAAYDQAHNWLVIVGCQDGSSDPCATFSDVWVLQNVNGLSGSTSQWLLPLVLDGTVLHPPAGNYGASSVYMTRRRRR